MKKWITDIISILYVVLFCYAAISKLLDYAQFIEQLRESPLKRFSAIIAWLTPATELLLSILLLIPKTRKAALYGCFTIMTAFTFYIIYILKYVPEIPCSCGGILENMNWTQHLFFNIIFVLLASISIILLKFYQKTHLINMRTKLAYGGMGLLLLILIIGAISVSAKGLRQVQPPRHGDPIPSLNLLLMDSSTIVNPVNTPEGKPIVLVWYNPDCSHCQEELLELTTKKAAASLSDIQFYFITSAEFRKAKVLYQKMGLNQVKYFTMTVDTSNQFNHRFKPWGTPFQLIYNKKHKLTKIIPNSAGIKDISEAIEQP